jgi:hypothetical protein
MRKTLIGFGIALVFVIGFLTGRWSAGGPPARLEGDGPESLRVRAVPDPHPEVTRERVACLIEMLASKNKSPKITGKMDEEDLFIEFPNGYDGSLQVPVYLAVQQLLAEGEGAFDQLLGHENDKRYSFTVKTADQRHYNDSVGDVCRAIVRRNVLCFEPELDFLTKGGPHHAELYDEPLAGWWKKNKHRGLVALQLEAIDETIAFMRDLDAVDRTAWHPDAEPLPIGKFNRVREENLRVLKATRQHIDQRGEPYRPKRLYSWTPHIIGLPWTRE